MSHKIVVILLVFILSACNPDNAEQPLLQLAGVNYLGDLPTLVAHKKQLFPKHHLNINVTFHDYGKQSLQALRAGEVDFALMAPNTFILDQMTNRQNDGSQDDLVILANLLHSTLMYQVLSTTTGKDIQTVADLKNGRVGLTKGANVEYIWWLYSIFYQVEADNIEIIYLPPDELGQALIDGKVDAIVAWQPWTNHFISEYGDLIQQVEGSHVYSAKWLLVTRRQIVQQYPTQCQQLLKAYAEAINVIHTDSENIMEMYTDVIHQQGITGEAYQPGLHQVNLNWSLISELHQGIQWARLSHFPGTEQETDVFSWFEPAPLQAVLPFSVKIPNTLADEGQP